MNNAQFHFGNYLETVIMVGHCGNNPTAAYFCLDVVDSASIAWLNYYIVCVCMCQIWLLQELLYICVIGDQNSRRVAVIELNFDRYPSYRRLFCLRARIPWHLYRLDAEALDKNRTFLSLSMYFFGMNEIVQSILSSSQRQNWIVVSIFSGIHWSIVVFSMQPWKMEGVV